MKVYPTAASHRLAKVAGRDVLVTLPAPKNMGYKSGLPRMDVAKGLANGHLRGAGVVHTLYEGPSRLKVEVLRHTNIERKWVGKRVGEVAPIVSTAKPARIAYGTSAAAAK